nr:MFS transporter [Micromonospora sp. DSM 115978]
VGPVVGPVLGGWLVESSWRWIFLVNLPVGLLAVALGLRLLPRDRPDGAGDRLDVGGLALVAPGLALAVYGLAEIGRGGGVTSWEVLLPAIVGLGLCGAFGLRAARIPAPLVRIRLLRRRALASGAGTVALFAAAYFGSMFVLPLYWQLARGLSPAQAGAIGIPQALATGVSLQVASRLVDRVAPARVVGVGIALAS